MWELLFLICRSQCSAPTGGSARGIRTVDHRAVKSSAEQIRTAGAEVVAVTATGDVGKATPYGTFPSTAAALEKLVKRLRQAGSGPLKFCYEAGPLRLRCSLQPYPVG
jgi:hypothetical protein